MTGTENGWGPRHRLIETDEVNLKVIDDGDGPLIVLLHGFGTTSHTWRKVLPVLVGAGYRVVAADLRGFGHSSCPSRISEYDALHYNRDFQAILDDVGSEKALVVGHDHGAFHAWRFVQMHPERVSGIAALGPVPLFRWSAPPTELARQLYAPGRFQELLYFCQVGPPEDELIADVRQTILKMFTSRTEELFARRPMAMGFLRHMKTRETPPPWLPAEDLDVYVVEYQRTGFFGGLAFYRNFDRNWHLLQPYADKLVEVPALFIAGELDPGLWKKTRQDLAEMEKWVPNLTDKQLLPGVGHLVQEEAADQVNTSLLKFLAGIDRWS
jgi:pimeloyl-ACP methyl ester carboxylesterase